MKVACISYRDWALAIYDEVRRRQPGHDYLVIRDKDSYTDQAVLDFAPDLALYYGWSWRVTPAITNAVTSLMLHPSPLPLYRGGSPIQNQIIRGESESAVSIFVISEELDAGPLVAQAPLSLQGHLDEIFLRMTTIGSDLTEGLLVNGLHPVEQDHARATSYTRRGPEDSEITLEELQNESSAYLFNKVRMLEDPYPNAYIRCSDGRRLLIKRVELEE